MPTRIVTNIAEASGEEGPSQDNKRALNVKHLAQLVKEAFYNKYRVIRDDGLHLSCAKIVEPAVLQPIDDSSVINDIVTLLEGRATPPVVKNEVFPTWRVSAAKEHPIRAHDIVPLIFKSDTATAWAWQRLNFDPVEIECPDLLTKMLCRTSPEEARSLVLWLGSLLDYRFPRSQYLYIHGEGNDGKSTLIKMLEKVLGKQGVTYMNSDNFADTHSTTALEGARLLIFSDENSASFMSRGRFKALTGDDTMTINPKGLPRRNIAISCKVMVASNYPPHVQGGRADLRRIIPVHLSPIDSSQSSHAEGLAFIEQGSAIMQFCYAAFRAWQAACPDQMLPASQAALEEVSADSMQTDMSMLLSGLLDFGSGLSVGAGELAAMLRPLTKGSGPGLQAAYAAIRREGARRVQITTSEGKRAWTWVGVKIRVPTH